MTPEEAERAARAAVNAAEARQQADSAALETRFQQQVGVPRLNALPSNGGHVVSVHAALCDAAGPNEFSNSVDST